MRLYSEPRGKAYEQVIDLAINNAKYFVLKVKSFLGDAGQDGYVNVMKALEPFLINTIEINVQNDNLDEVIKMSERYKSNAFYTAGTYNFYSCSEESGMILKQKATRLSDWAFPNMPEDLCFFKKDGDGDYLYSIVHENMYGLGVTEEEAIELMDQITGLFLEIEAHRDFERLLDDAIKHQTDRLYISRYELSELPERIRELTQLRELEIFEQDLFRLPEHLFELRKLESLTIYTYDLESIPASIGRLKHLRKLIIYCGSMDRPAPGQQVKPQKDISLDRIPPEIGELEQLEQISICYSSISELPVELEKLKKLRILELRKCMIDRKPDFLNRMKQLEYVHMTSEAGEVR